MPKQNKKSDAPGKSYYVKGILFLARHKIVTVLAILFVLAYFVNSPGVLLSIFIAGCIGYVFRDELSEIAFDDTVQEKPKQTYAEHPAMPERIMPKISEMDLAVLHSPVIPEIKSETEIQQQTLITPSVKSNNDKEKSTFVASNTDVPVVVGIESNMAAATTTETKITKNDEDLVSYLTSELTPEPIFTIPKSTSQVILSIAENSTHVDSNKPARITPETAKWYGIGEKVEVRGYLIHGLVYVGDSLAVSKGQSEPALINPHLGISREVDYTISNLGYYPNYSDISDLARASYLSWLANGKCDPAADISYVFMYFYGLERRLLIDLSNHPENKGEYAVIIGELIRLLAIYGTSSKSFHGYCSRLLDYAQFSYLESKLYLEPLPEYGKNNDIPVHLRITIGQCMQDAIPVPLQIIKAWVKYDSSFETKNCVQNYSNAFFLIFDVLFGEMYPNGLLIAACASRVTLEYFPASSTFFFDKPPKVKLQQVPDIKAVTAPVKKVQHVVDQTIQIIEPLKRAITKQNSLNSSMSYMLLPGKFWPAHAKNQVNSLVQRCEGALTVLTGNELQKIFDTQTLLTKDQYRILVQELQSRSVEVEPALSKMSVPTANEYFVLFKVEDSDKVPSPAGSTESGAQYKSASAMLDLACAVAQADGVFSSEEVIYINKQIDSWLHLDINARLRLRARLRLLINKPISMSSLRARIAFLDAESKSAMAKFATSLVHADGTVTVDEIKFLNKIYTLLELDPSTVSNDIYAASSPTVIQTSHLTESQKTVTTPTFVLDKERIANLQSQSQQIAILLGNIFSDPTDHEEIVSKNEMNHQTSEPHSAILQSTAITEDTVLGLDTAHTAFMRMLISKSKWSRAEVDLLAQQYKLMTDGALERINDVAYDHFDMPLTEGDEHIDINLELKDKF